MSTDYGEKERAFIDGLKEATGRDLKEWMAALAAQKLTERNDIILWLRRQGFMFAKASWLERIHHNSGKPIYAESVGHAPRREPRTPRPVRAPAAPPPAQAAGSVASAATAPVEVETAPALVEVPLSAPMSAPALAPLAVSPPVTVPAAGELEPLLAKGKAYRPLAQHLIAQIKGVRPTASLVPQESYLAIADPAEFARLGVGSKELRLHLALGEYGFDQVVLKGAPGGGLGKGDALTHMIVLTDARQVDKRLLELVARAAMHVNG